MFISLYCAHTSVITAVFFKELKFVIRSVMCSVFDG